MFPQQLCRLSTFFDVTSLILVIAPSSQPQALPTCVFHRCAQKTGLEGTSGFESNEKTRVEKNACSVADGEVGAWESNDPCRVGRRSRRRAMQIFVYSSGSQTLSTQNLFLLASERILQTPFRFTTQCVSSFMSHWECCSVFVLV